MKKRYNYKQISFLDDCFTYNKEWLREFIRRYKEKINLPFRAISHPLFINKEIAKLLKEAGCIKLQLGAQSPIEKIRREICKRNMSNKQISDAVRIAKKAGLYVSVDHIFGLPTEKLEDYEQGLDFYIGLKPHWYFSFFLQYYPNTEIVDIGKRYGTVTDELIKNGKICFGIKRTNPKLIEISRFLYFIPLLPKSISRFLLKKKIYSKIFRYNFLNNLALLIPHFYSIDLFKALIFEIKKIIFKRKALSKANSNGKNILMPEHLKNKDLKIKAFSYFQYQK